MAAYDDDSFAGPDPHGPFTLGPPGLADPWRATPPTWSMPPEPAPEPRFGIGKYARPARRPRRRISSGVAVAGTALACAVGAAALVTAVWPTGPGLHRDGSLNVSQQQPDSPAPYIVDPATPTAAPSTAIAAPAPTRPAAVPSKRPQGTNAVPNPPQHAGPQHAGPQHTTKPPKPKPKVCTKPLIDEHGHPSGSVVVPCP
jgi:hypothetical protein